MASVFTFDSNPPRVSSPWPPHVINTTNGTTRVCSEESILEEGGTPRVIELSECGITRLESEPQEGPTEYKLHLLLRPRRSFVALSTRQTAPRSQQPKSGPIRLDSQSDPKPIRPSSSPKPSSQSRQNRLQNLTTQLLWRLQQSSPYHSSSRSGLVVPVLSQGRTDVAVADGPESLLPGLEESQGALYEIGVSDDGVLVGLTEDELTESLNTLRAMAFSLGCRVEVLRKVIVGDCRWVEESQTTQGLARKLHHENLLVVEALVIPSFDVQKMANCPSRSTQLDDGRISKSGPIAIRGEVAQVESQAEQLRVSLTGSTTSGKSSLLGTLSTSVLDNGRGKSRLSMLKHRHEIMSGISSSVTPELIGYQDSSVNGVDGVTSCTNVINYASGNISSWTDIHSAAVPGRLVLVTDSAGHPRYRHTMMRGLISWAPHWTICCVAAEGSGDDCTRASSPAFSQGRVGFAANDGDPSRSHLQLCLKLELPLVVVITKLDLASKPGLRQTLNSIVSTLKAAGRRTKILPTTTLLPDQDPLLQSLRIGDEKVVKQLIASSCKEDDITLLVPIILTSAVNGTGIGHLHALLRHLPPINPKHKAPTPDAAGNIGPSVLFHVDEVFSGSEGHTQSSASAHRYGTDAVLSGHLRYGEVSIGDLLLVGPFTAENSLDDAQKIKTRQMGSSLTGNGKKSGRGLAYMRRDYYQALSEEDASGALATMAAPAWRKVRVESLRNLRLPVRKLLAGQVGTVGISWGRREDEVSEACMSTTTPSRLRKRMVAINFPLIGRSDEQIPPSPPSPPPSYRSFCASFDESNAISLGRGSIVIVYIASVRSASKIVSISSPGGYDDVEDGSDSDDDGGVAVSGFLQENEEEEEEEDESHERHSPQEVKIRFLTSREWIEIGTRVLVMPGGGGGSGGSGDSPRGNTSGSADMQAFVGTVTKVFL